MSFSDDPFNDNFDDPMDDIKGILDDVPSDFRAGFPKIEILHQGQKTIIHNFTQIIRKINRSPNHLKKYLSSGLGTKTKIKGDQLELHSQFSESQLIEITQQYARDYIICPNCGKPDTIIQEKKKKSELRCVACGTISSIDQ